MYYIEFTVPQTLKRISGKGRQSKPGTRQFNKGPTQTEKKFRVILGVICSPILYNTIVKSFVNSNFIVVL